MKELLLIDFKSVFKNNKFKLITLIIILVPSIAFLMACKFYYGLPPNFIRSATDENFLNGTVSRHIKLWFILILPLLSVMICSDIYSFNYNSGIFKNILTRTSKKNYVFSKIIVVFTVTFFIIFVSLLLNELLSILTFPAKGLDNPRKLPSFDIGYFNYDPKRFLDIIRIKNIYIYDLIYIIIFSFVGSLYALLSITISFFIKNSKIFILGSFIVYFCIYQIFLNFRLEKYHLNAYLDGDSVGNYVFILWIIALLLPSIALTIIHLKVNDEI
ncbi:MAG: ABC transporter permease [Romboutsia sp.]|nr:ABC transporter permease [Romboutsia sp.]